MDASGRSKKILIIDDDNRNIFALKAVLKAKGHDVLFADDAQRGIEMMKEDREISIVLLDMMMPDMDGYEALRVIRRTAEIATMPVIAVTAQAMVGDKEKCIEAGADGYISKPVDIDALTEHLKKHLG